jgi:uncharacterized RDD family membrane protein YckC
MEPGDSAAPGFHGGSELGLPATGPGSLATIPRRFVGAIIDWLVLSPVIIVSYLVRHARFESVVNDTTGRATSRMVIDPQPVWLAVVAIVIGGVYVITLIGWRGQTVGESLFGLKVIRIGDRQIPGNEIAARRWSVIGSIAIASAVVFQFKAPGSAGISFAFSLLELLVLAWAIWDPNRQGLHDRFAGTIVVRARW